MKKLFKYILYFILIVILLPNFCTRKKKSLENNENVQTTQESQEKVEEKVQYDYAKYKTIKLYHSKSSNIEELPIDEYLYGVVSSEMPASYEKEALKAQAIVARTYTIYQITKSNRKTW